MSVAFDNRVIRAMMANRPTYVDITGTTNASANTQTLFAHTLRDAVGNAVAPSFVMVTPSAATPAGHVYYVHANSTTTQVDIRATGSSVAFRARLFL